MGSGTGAPEATGRSGYVEANGVNYFYRIQGEGEPLLLLHGGLGSMDMFGSVLPVLAEHRQVVAVDLHGHGRTALGDRKIDLVAMGDDMAAVLDALNYEQVDVLGYSMGGGVAFRLAVQSPDKVRRLVLVSTGFSQDGFHPEILPQQAQLSARAAPSMAETPMYAAYMAVAPHPDEFPLLLDRMGEHMRTPFNWAEDVRKLVMPTMLIFGDSDMYRLEHVVEFFHRLGGGLRDGGWMGEGMSPNRLAILPGMTHYEIFMAPEMAQTALPFLDGA